MPIYERHLAAGSWELTLADDTPDSVLDAASVPFSHLVVLPAWVPAGDMSDAAMLSAARYTGVVLRPPRQRQIGGAGLAWWLGDPDGDGDSLTTAITYSADTFQSAVAAVIPATLTAGSIETAGGAISGVWRWISRRDLLDAVCDFFGREWLIQPDFSVDAGTAAVLFGSTPTVVLGPEVGSSDITIDALPGRVMPRVDFTRWRSAVTVLGRGGVGSAAASSPATYYDGLGGTVARRALLEMPDAPTGGEATVAAALADELADPSLTSAVEVTTWDRDPRARVRAGDPVWLYDAANGIFDTSNQVEHRGKTLWPVESRVWGIRWPITAGMGVYIRTHNGTSATWVDITRYVAAETPGATLEVGPRRLAPTGERLAQVAANRDRWLHSAWEAYTPTWATTGSPPSLGNGTIVGSWRRVGTSMSVTARLTIGSTTSVGSGTWYLGLPGTAAETGHISAQILDSASRYYSAQAQTVTGDNRVTVIAEGSLAVTGTSPMTWAAGDYVEWSGTLEVV